MAGRTNSIEHRDGGQVSESEMTDEEFAALEFEPWQHTTDEWTPPSNAEWARLANPHLVMIRVAWLIHYKTKAELVEMIEGMDKEDIFTSTMERIQDTSDWLKGLSAIVNGAQARVFCAGLSMGDCGETGK